MPEHVVTFLLTEVVDSIRRWEDDEAGMVAATERLDGIVQQLVGDFGGTLVKPRGEGDSHFLVFDRPQDAVTCAVALQRRVYEETGLPLKTSSHLGAAEFRGGDWYGTTVNRCARLRAAANPRQSLVSADVAAVVASSLADGIALRSLGRHRLKDLDEPTEVFQVCAEGLVPEHPPLATLAQSHGVDLPSGTFVGRAHLCARVVDLVGADQVVRVVGAPGVGTTRVALEAAVQWWERHAKPVRVNAPRRAPGELVVLDGADADEHDGPAIVVTRRPVREDEAVVRVPPLDPLDAERLLRDRLGDEAQLPAEVVGRCDGLPLAIELLARRATSVDGAVLAERLAADALAVLGGNRRADPVRHASMRATFAAAFAALTASEQAALLAAAPGDPRWVAAGWHEVDGPLQLVAAFLREQR